MTSINLIAFEFVMENVGKSLDHYYFNNNMIDIGDAFRIFSEVVEIMDFMERRKIVYGDLKLGNLILDNNSNSLKLIDYDSSFLEGFSGGIPTNESSGIPGYTMGYGSPEICKIYQPIKENGGIRIFDNRN